MLNILVFLLVLGLLVFFHELGHFLTAKRAGIKVEEFGFGFPPRLIAFRWGETEYSLNLIPLGGFVRMLGEEDPTEPRSFASTSKLWRSAVLVAGPAMNFVLAALLFGFAYMAGWPTVTETEVQIMSVLEDSPAARADVRPGDVIVAMDGQPIKDTLELRERTQERLGQGTTLTVRRDGQTVNLSLVPNPEWDPDRGALGVTIANRNAKVEPVSYPVGEALWLGVRQLGEIVALIAALPAMLIGGLIPAEMARPVGPVGIFQVTSQAAAETVSTGWWFPLIYVTAVLSVGLGLANLLPFPGLDGGRLVFVALEAIRGRRISPRREGLIHLVGMAILLTLVVVISYYDLASPLPDLDWGVR